MCRPMKTFIKLSLALVFFIPIGFAQDKDEEKPTYRDAATHDKLVDKYQSAKKNLDSGEPKDLLKGRTDPTKENRPKNLIESSDVIVFNGLTTLVPKGAILKLPERYSDRVGKDRHERTNRVVTWPEFYSRNRGWITTVEVTRALAHGEARFAEELIKQLRKSPNMVVSTLATGPIGMIPHKETGAAPLSLPEDETEQPDQPDQPKKPKTQISHEK